MAKQRRVAKSTRTPKPRAARKKAASRGSPAARKRAAPRKRRPAAAETAVAPPRAKPGFYEAVAIYERGVQALQRHNFQTAADFFRNVLEHYPEERELLERARLYFRVCERETARQPPAPKNPEERIYAATMALNAGDYTQAMDHLQRALAEDPDSDHAHYTMAVVLGMRSRVDEAIEHLRQAIALNQENRALARQDRATGATRPRRDGYTSRLWRAPTS
jgi:Tfp pilus assembly protein PilF